MKPSWSLGGTAAVFRIRLFRPSETFITDQARCVSRFRVRLFGREAESRAPAAIDYRVPPAGGRMTKARRVVFGADHFYRETLTELQPDLVHAHFGVDAVAVLAAARQLDLPLVTTFHGYDATTRLSRLVSSGSPTLIRYALGRRRLADEGRRFICVSDFILAKVLALGFPEERVVKHYIGTDITRFAGVKRAGPGDRPTVLHVARLVEKKGTADLLRSFALVRKKVPEAQLVIIGDGPLRLQLEKLATEAGIARAVRFLGAQPHDEVLDWLRKAELFCLPSVTASNGDTEGLPISIIEAAAAGLPIVATRHSGIPEAVQHEVGGLLVAEHDVPGLAAAMTQLLTDSVLAERLGRGAQTHVRAHFDLRQQGRKLERIYVDAAA